MRLPLKIHGDISALAEGEGRTLLRIYAVGDLHGQLPIFDEMLGKIAEDLAAHPVEAFKLVFTGDYVDRGPDARGVVDRVSALKRDGFLGGDVICLRGNHEQWLLDFLGGEDNLGLWLVKGGRETMLSYGALAADEHPDLADPAVNAMLRARLTALMPAQHRTFLTALPLTHAHEGFFFVHAGVNPERSLAEQIPYELIWIREPFLSHPLPHGKVVVHGHTCCKTVESHSNRINIDTGIYVQGHLSCVILEGGERHLLQTFGEPCADYVHFRSSLITRLPKSADVGA